MNETVVNAQVCSRYGLHGLGVLVHVAERPVIELPRVEGAKAAIGVSVVGATPSLVVNERCLLDVLGLERAAVVTFCGEWGVSPTMKIRSRLVHESRDAEMNAIYYAALNAMGRMLREMENVREVDAGEAQARMDEAFSAYNEVMRDVVEMARNRMNICLEEMEYEDRRPLAMLKHGAWMRVAAIKTDWIARRNSLGDYTSPEYVFDVIRFAIVAESNA